MGKIINFNSLREISRWHPEKRRVLCHGAFDLFHIGHLAHLRSARKFGDLLVVTITADQFVNKGPGRPRYRETERASLCAAIEGVDYVAINPFPKALEAILELKPDFYVKGPDYREKQKDITGGIQQEEDTVRSVGGRLAFTDDPTESSTELVNQYFSQFDEEQSSAIACVKAASSIAAIEDLIESFKNLKVLVVGEPIVDTYVYCQPEGLSSKSPTISARFLSQEDYAGGSLAIANHLHGLGCQVSSLVTHGDEPYFQELLRNSLASGIKLYDFPLAATPTPQKTRYVVPFRAQRIFELINLRSDQWAHSDPKPFEKRLTELAREHDLVIVADFGHGLFENSVLEALEKVERFIALNVQSNSGNFGFNVVTKHRRFDYVSLDERESRLVLHDRLSSSLEISDRLVREITRVPTAVTLGTAGSVYYDSNMKPFLMPSFFKNVVDTTGAGDAYFTLTALLAKLKASSPLLPFMGNVYAGLKSQIIGNKAPVSKASFIKSIRSMLG